MGRSSGTSTVTQRQPVTTLHAKRPDVEEHPLAAIHLCQRGQVHKRHSVQQHLLPLVHVQLVSTEGAVAQGERLQLLALYSSYSTASHTTQRQRMNLREALRAQRNALQRGEI